ncbi:uncharacterized protein V6R79_010770 [Siganus canaliculatus]
MANNPEEAPLARGSLAGSEEVLVAQAGPRGGSNSRALKVAGLTTLACLLLASQVFTAYMVFNQKQQIHSLQRNSERAGRVLTRPSQAMAPVRMQMPMDTLPLLSLDELASVKPKTEVQDIVATVEQDVKEVLQNIELPHFNSTFLANLLSLQQQNDTEWQSFQSWMRYWLVFQMAQQKPPTPTSPPATMIKTKCQIEAAPEFTQIGRYKPQCDEQGRYKPVQCWHATGFCWCVREDGTAIEGTAIRGHPNCQRSYFPRRMMAAPLQMQKTISVDE